MINKINNTTNMVTPGNLGFYRLFT